MDQFATELADTLEIARTTEVPVAGPGLGRARAGLVAALSRVHWIGGGGDTVLVSGCHHAITLVTILPANIYIVRHWSGTGCRVQRQWSFNCLLAVAVSFT